MKSPIHIVLLLIALAGIGAKWKQQLEAASELRAQIARLRLENEDSDQVKSEHARLRQLQRAIETPNVSQRPLPDRESTSAVEERNTSSPTSLATGEWAPHTAWKNRGRNTPAATLETIFWAAVGGDLTTLKNTLLPDEEMRAKAETLFSKLPAGSRSLVTTPEELIAATVGRSIPLGEARVVWQQQSDPDSATLCVMMKKTPAAATQPALPAGPAENAPASSAIPSEIKTAYLTLRRSDEYGWRLVVKRP